MRGTKLSLLMTSAASLLLAGCGGGAGDAVQSTPAPIGSPSPTPSATPTPTASTPAGSSSTDYNTAEYRASAGPAMHGAITAYQQGASGAGVTVGIVDSGITDADGEFTGRISPLSRDFAGNGSYNDVGGHGTAVAETLAGARNGAHVQGMAFDATILALRTDKPGSCAGSGCEHTTTAMAQAIDYAWQNGAKIINVSLGGDINSSDLLGAVSRATAAGSIVVVAAGNAKTGEAASAAPDLMAASMANSKYSHGLVIVATSVGKDGLVSSFSNGARGYETTSLAALGDSVQTVNNLGTDLLYTGTSFSAPQIAGAAALLAQAFPNLTSAQIVQLLLSTAQDAGATGPDAQYGMGILDVAAAFAPQGRLSLAGSQAPLSASEPTLLSGAMGDATPAGLSAIILDGYRRPFQTDLAGRVERPALRSKLTAALAGTTKQVSGIAGPLQLSLSIAPGRRDASGLRQLSLTGSDARQGRVLSGMIATRLSEKSAMVLGLRTSLRDSAAMLDGTPRPAFLMAEGGAGALTGEMHAGSSLALRQAIGKGLALVSGMETGTLDSNATRPGLLADPASGRRATYQSLLSALAYDHGRLGLTGGMRLMGEQGSALGARFAPALGAQSATSLFATLDARFAAAPGLTLSASFQQGWTYAAAGGALDQGGTLKSRSWSLDLARTSLFARGDLFGLRVSAPLRVTASRFMLDLPQSWDWESQTATNARAPLDLVPRGSERDYELSYGLGVSGGWLGANLYMRSEAGNVAATPDDYGAALRWTARF